MWVSVGTAVCECGCGCVNVGICVCVDVGEIVYSGRVWPCHYD